MENYKTERVIAYIDGYNLFFGLKDAGYKKLIWLNVSLLISNLLKSNQTLVEVNYFTTLITNNVDKRLRQKTYINALLTLPLVKIHYGKFQKESSHCIKCGNSYQSDCEKMTDVAISTRILSDYYEDRFDMAMVVSGDTDLIPPIRLINEKPDNKRVFVAFPPQRINDEVRKFAKGDMVIGRKKLADSQLPDTVETSGGARFLRPDTWK